MDFLTKLLVSSSGFSKNLSGLFDFTVDSNGVSLFFLFFLLVIFLVALSFGKTRIVLALLATYISAFLESTFIYRLELEKFFGDFLKLPAIFWTRFLVFVVFFIVVFLILNRSILRPKMSLQESPPIAILFLSVLQGIFWLSLITSYLPVGVTIISEPFTKKYLVLPSIKFAVAILPLAALFFFKRKRPI
ncbi:MAG: hypothetical protein A3C71_01845 [Candidatus Yanofskybacteria bacterium RIFCSPHIGHO2_02_FULL_43_15c]|uniref:Uncharacterized protein n=2 Tax=Candidatus Yanofskyibacteriota TaxID=1752733 RepID=A0A1F8H6J3_9BACT|nr:MAG: hypothetical protein A3C71_01845 [Candidatus Yanofskybacteria bacterium RIFCSPHIGHO2_02_FULL_43_15c]OGN32648.1 MAG: hypothetical protein A3I92_02140 [Candidatus Yanofskybacteria bacterium RIFCSPLOWO2_02_FULL_43_10b]